MKKFEIWKSLVKPNKKYNSDLYIRLISKHKDGWLVEKFLHPKIDGEVLLGSKIMIIKEESIPVFYKKESPN